MKLIINISDVERLYLLALLEKKEYTIDAENQYELSIISNIENELGHRE